MTTGLDIHQFSARDDNFAVLVHDPASGATAAIDAPEAAAIERALAEKGWRLTHILVTHHHGDHVEGIAPLKAKWKARVIAHDADAARIPEVDETFSAPGSFQFAGHEVRVIPTPGHTSGQVALYFPGSHAVFAADALFSLGCGRVIEGSMEEMWGSLERLRQLPGDTAVYCGHEYTAANARFALSVEPGNMALQRRAAEVTALRAAGKPTLPTTIAAEKAANPFLRPESAEIRTAVKADAATPNAEVFARLRRAKDNFR